MYYPSYEDYMRDIFYFNGLQNGNIGYPYMAFQTQNLNDYYPSIYRIIHPVVQKVVSGNNYQFTNEDSVNNIVDVVLGITAGDLNTLENVGNPDSNKKTVPMSNSNTNVVAQDNNSNALLKDLIKILTIKELQSKQNIRRFPYTYGNMVPYNMPREPYMVN